MTWRDEIDMEIRRQAIRLYPDCAALFELPRRVYAQIMQDNSMRRKLPVSEVKIRKIMLQCQNFSERVERDMYQRVSTEEFFKVIGPLNVTLEIRGNYPYKTLFRLKQGGKLVGFEEHERYYLNVEDTRS